MYPRLVAALATLAAALATLILATGLTYAAEEQ
jgi:hypothetical protein